MKTEQPSLSEYQLWRRENPGRWFFEKLEEMREEFLTEVENGALRGDRDSGVSTDYKAGEISGSLAVVNRVLKMHEWEGLKPDREEI